MDFLIQLDLESLKACLLNESFSPTVSTAHNNANPLSNGSFLDTMRHMDFTRFRKFCTILNRIQGNLEFTQSLSEYFATDDMVEPALLVVSAAIRRDINLAKSLRGGSVAASALMYRHQASPRDHDFSARRSTFREQRTQNSRHRFSTSISRRQTKFTTTPTYPIGTCWRFQATDTCDDNDCQYDHTCCKCHSSSHGKKSCPDEQ